MDGALGVAEDQHAVTVLFEQLAEHVLHFYVGLDDHQLARFALIVEAFAAVSSLPAGLPSFAFFQALDRELEVDEHVATAFGNACRVRLRAPCSRSALSGKRHFGVDVENRLDVVVEGFAGLLAVADIGQRGTAGQHLVEDRAGEINVAARVVHVAASGAFEAGVENGAAAEAFHRFLFGPFDAGQAEVDELRFAFAGEEHVRHFEVAVRDAVLLQSVVEAGHHAFDDMGGFDGAELASCPVELAEVSALDEVHDDVVRQALRINFVNFDDVRVLQLLAKFALAAEEIDVELERLVRFLVDSLRVAEAGCEAP